MSNKLTLLLLRVVPLPLLLFYCVFTVLAQEENFDYDASVKYAFGQELRFSLGMSDANSIEKINLLIRPELDNQIYIIDVPFEPGDTISVTHSVPVTEVRLKPFSQVNYHWEFQTTDGIIEESAVENFNYEDDRFVWQQMSQDAITVHWTGSGPFFGQDILTTVQGALEHLASILPIEEINPFDVYVYPSSADLRAALRLADISSDSPSHPELGVILVTAVNPQSAVADLGQSVPYELTQLLLYSVSGNQFANIPWWLTEGIATSVQVEANPRYEQLIKDAVVSKNMIPLEQLCQKTERVSDRDLLATAQSNSIVSYITQRYGKQSLSDLVTAYNLGDTCEIGVNRVLGVTLKELEQSWLEDKQDDNAFSRLLSAYGLWVVLLLGGILLMIIIIMLSSRNGKTD